MKRKRHSPCTWRHLRLAHAAGHGLRELAREMGIPEGTVLVRAKREMWVSTIESTLRLVESVEITPAAKKARGIAEAALQTRLQLAEALSKAAEHAASLSSVDLIEEAENLSRLAKASALVFGWKSA